VNNKKDQHFKGRNKPAGRQPINQPENVRPKPPKKPFFSKELLIKLLPLIKAFVLWFIMIAIVHIPGIKDDFRHFFVGFTTASTTFIGKLFFLPVERLAYSTFSVDGFTMEIIVECTAYNFYLFAIALSVFANWSTRHKLINLMIFIGVIFMVNILRFYAMGYVGRHYPEIFDTTHDYVWNILFGFMIFGVWAWRDKVNNPDFKPREDQP
jgi:exosortase/archaeosortase family protein